MSGPPTRAEGIEVHEVADGFVVYHAARDRVHYLNHTAALVLEFCTGQNPPQRIARLLQRAYDLPQPPGDEVAECLAQLRQEGLVG
jgi:hypothetical protein